MNICFTGHRPNKLGGYDWNTEYNQQIIKTLVDTIVNIIKNEPKDESFHFITGGALGVDQMAYCICDMIKTKSKYKKITTEIAVPFKDQSNAWFKQEDKVRYLYQLNKADKVTYVDEIKEYQKTKTQIGKYNAYKLQIRNEYMVDNSDLIIAVWDGSKSGTGNCVKYAEKLNKKIIIINPKKIIKY